MGDTNPIGSPGSTGASCVICSEALTRAKTIMPCCFQELCTTCFAKCIALNSGDENGTTRNQCPFCREEFCEKVVPDTKFTILLDNYKESLYIQRCRVDNLQSRNRVQKSDIEYLTIRLNQEIVKSEKLKVVVDDRAKTIFKMSKKIYMKDKKIYNINLLCNCIVTDWDKLSSNYSNESDTESDSEEELNDWTLDAIESTQQYTSAQTIQEAFRTRNCARMEYLYHDIEELD
tara:strand:- start:331 stop:1026 length:696 start_codon:yes stop_codon:yes gene_type:complete